MSFAVCHEESRSRSRRRKNAESIVIIKKAQTANGWMDKSMEQEERARARERQGEKNLVRLSVKSVDFFSGRKAIIDFVVRKAFSGHIAII